MSTTTNDRGWIGRREQVPVADLSDLLTSFFMDEDGALLSCFHMLQSAVEISDIKSGLPADPTAWEQGRCFGCRGELRWQRRSDGAFDLLCLTEEEGAMPTDFVAAEWRVRRPVVGEDAAIYLWPLGETRIPRRLQYPGNRQRLSYREYQTASGVTQFTRLVEVV